MNALLWNEDEASFEAWWEGSGYDETVKDIMREAYIAGWDAFASSLSGGV